jgi:hypothetical protein
MEPRVPLRVTVTGIDGTAPRTKQGCPVVLRTITCPTGLTHIDDAFHLTFIGEDGVRAGNEAPDNLRFTRLADGGPSFCPTPTTTDEYAHPSIRLELIVPGELPDSVRVRPLLAQEQLILVMESLQHPESTR